MWMLLATWYFYSCTAMRTYLYCDAQCRWFTDHADVLSQNAWSCHLLQVFASPQELHGNTPKIKDTKMPFSALQLVLLSQSGCAMLRVCQ